jgi:hypothetical protein
LVQGKQAFPKLGKPPMVAAPDGIRGRIEDIADFFE